MARVKKSDFRAPNGRVFIIRDNDVRVNMTLEERGATTTSSSTA
jgi:hypothetical protein